MHALTPGPAPAPRNQTIVAASVGAAATLMLIGGMLAVWAVKRSAMIATGEPWLPSSVTIPEVPTNVMLIAFAALCSFAQWAIWSAARDDRANTVFALAVTGFVALLVLNAQAFVWSQMEIGVFEGEYGSMFFAITGTFFALMIAGLLMTVVTLFRYLAGRTRDRELLVAHAIYWYALTVAFSAIWFVVYVTK
ncbi:cytochrome c oxidase subunit 3 [Ilumatobacter sp.]|uniref:cytochrome c oxidase subunit 3 n=1 Tax=Ilumatobacter sp. TaxID=1967498 RepID=UPI003B52D461